MPIVLLLVLSLSLPFGGPGTLLKLGAFQLDAPAFLALAALAWSLPASLFRGNKPDTAGWAAIGWAGAWLVSSLAAPAAWVPASQSAWHLAVGPLLFTCARPLLTPRQAKVLLAGLGTAAVAGIFLHPPLIFGPASASPAPAIPWAAFTANPLTGSGPGIYPDLPLWAGLLPRGGLLAAGAALFLLGAVGSRIHLPASSLTWKDAILPALPLAALSISGFFLDPLSGTRLGLGFWLFLSALVPPGRPAYNGKRRA